MVQEVLEGLQCQSGRIYLDGTVGLGGHAEAILSHSAPSGRLVGLDQDPANLQKARARLQSFGSRALLIHSNYSNLIEVLEKSQIIAVAGILLDLGLSTEQLKISGRGFSFGGDETLDMRMNPDAQTMTAADLLNAAPEAELSRLFWELGEERWARRIARRVVQSRRHTPVTTTAQLVDLIRQAIPAKAAFGRIHPATRIFQALRIVVNQELERLTAFIPQAITALEPHGRLVIISYHSLEDRIVKRAFLAAEKAGRLQRLTKKPLVPQREEIQRNPSARSAKLRIAAKLPQSLANSTGEVILSSSFK
jgi:16S rRNA (cytosine1402-N4)-methyltransferase